MMLASSETSGMNQIVHSAALIKWKRKMLVLL